MAKQIQFETLGYDVEDGILLVTLRRPDRLNAFTEAMGDELIAAFDAADADDNVRAIVVTGAGRGFCAGADLKSRDDGFAGDDASRPHFADGTRRDGGGRLALRIYESRKPVIAAINGPAVGVGASMTLPMDVRLASTDARFGFVFARRGITPESTSSWFLPRLVGVSKAMEWVATGRVFDAEEALRGGLVRSLHPPGELLSAAIELAREIAHNSAPVSVAVSRHLIYSMLGESHPWAAHEMESRALAIRGRSADAREGIDAFLAKRPAQFPDRVSEEVPTLLARLSKPHHQNDITP